MGERAFARARVLSPPLVEIRQREQVQAGEKEQGKYAHGRQAQPVAVLSPYHSNAVDDDGHGEDDGQPTVGLPNPFAPVQVDLLRHDEWRGLAVNAKLSPCR